MNSWKNQIVIKTLVPFVAAYLIICVVRSQTASLTELMASWQSIVAIGALSFGLALFQDLFPKSLKEILVFWRVRNRVPGFRAFSPRMSYGELLDRDEVLAIEDRQKLSPKMQNRMFYRLYNKCRDSGAVSNSSYRYLQWRELAFLALISSIAVFVIYVRNRGITSLLPWELAGYGLVTVALSVIAARKSANELIGFVLLHEVLESEGNGHD